MQKLQMTDADIAEFTRLVREIKFFAAMNMGLLEKILAHVGIYAFKKGDNVCRQGDPGDSFYVVKEGKLKVSVREAFLFSRTVAWLGPGQCFGEMALLFGKPRNATVACEEDSKVFVLLAESFNEVLRQNPSFKAEINKLASDREFELIHNK